MPGPQKGRKAVKIPLLKTRKRHEMNAYYRRCLHERRPYAVFVPNRKYGYYECDLLPADLRLSEEGYRVFSELVLRFYRRWQSEGKLKEPVHFNGPVWLHVSPCPIGEEDEFHAAVVDLLTRYAVPE